MKALFFGELGGYTLLETNVIPSCIGYFESMIFLLFPKSVGDDVIGSL